MTLELYIQPIPNDIVTNPSGEHDKDKSSNVRPACPRTQGGTCSGRHVKTPSLNL